MEVSATQLPQTCVCMSGRSRGEGEAWKAGEVSDLWRVQSWQMLNQRSAVEQMWEQMLSQQHLLVVVLLRGMSRLHVSEPFLLCAAPFHTCLLLQRGLTSHLPACDLKL